MDKTNQKIKIKEYFNSTQFIEDIKKQNFTSKEARQIYYRCINKEESKKINLLTKISPEMNIENSINRSLQDIKRKEQLCLKLEIFRREYLISIETTLIECIKHNDLPWRTIEETEKAIQCIKTDILQKSKEYPLIFGNNNSTPPTMMYYILLQEYSKKGISDLLHLSTELYKNHKGKHLTFDSAGMTELCDVWLSFIKDYRYIKENFLQVYKNNEEYIASLFRGKQSNNKNTFQKDKIIKEVILSQNEEQREEILKELVTQACIMASMKKKIRSNYEFLHNYYDDRLKRYSEVQKYLSHNIAEKGEFNPKNNNSRMIFISFAVILRDLKNEHSNLSKQSFVNFGPQGYTYKDITYRLLMTIEVLHSSYMQLSKFSMIPALSKEFSVLTRNTTVEFNGEKKEIPLTMARNYCRNKLNELSYEIQSIRKGRS